MARWLFNAVIALTIYLWVHSPVLGSVVLAVKRLGEQGIGKTHHREALAEPKISLQKQP